MMLGRFFRSAAVLCALGAGIAGQVAAQAGGGNVLGTANIWEADPANAGLDGTSPFFVNITATGSFRTATFGATGTVGCCGSLAFNGPDGGSSFNTSITSAGGISGISGDWSLWLVGVWLGPGVPAVAPAGGAFPFSVQDDPVFIAYALGQVFFIGDGLTGTGSGSVQTWLVPDGATRLYLGFADASGFNGSPGSYSDNPGSLDVTWNIADGRIPNPSSTVPEPATMTLLATGLATLAGVRRRRR